jgi:lipopolysaccharide/colanic/teichoic acid biosynthesis glycosyltransferase
MPQLANQQLLHFSHRRLQPGEEVVNTRRSLDDAGLGLFATDPEPVGSHTILSEKAFHKMIASERKRTERSHKPFLVMLLDLGEERLTNGSTGTLGKILDVLALSTRETDAVGWYKDGLVVGVTFTELDVDERRNILNTMLTRVSSSLQDSLSLEQFSQISISFHWFPEEWGHGVPKRPSNPVFYPDLRISGNGKTISGGIKRVMDIVGSVLALIVFSPLFFAVVVAIKLNSKGPAIFRQERLGQFGRSFTFLKFRSMYVNNDLTIHEEFMKRVIHGEYKGKDGDGGQTVYKMEDDPRITKVGRFLRRTSLDELPQFINVLKGDMSLVGPRPPLAYECQQYDLWHRRRVLEAKPGITGLWQVNGRSRVRFDDIVRLDLRYVRTRSVWLDIRILLQTPKAVFFSNDAF